MNPSIYRTPQTRSTQHALAISVHCDAEPFAEQLELSCIHPQLVPMRRHGLGYLIHPSADSWRQLPNARGFAGFGLLRGMRMLLDVLAGLRALHQTYLSSGVPFAHGEVAPLHFRIDPFGVCRLVPIALRQPVGGGEALPRFALGYLSPERLIRQPVGVRADVFSIGVLLWEALASRRLFDEPNVEAIVERMMRAEIEPPDVPAHFSWAAPLKTQLSHALKVNQLRRQVDCSQLAEVIAGVARDRLPSHAELAEYFFGRQGLPRSSGSSAAPAAPTAVPAGRVASAPSKSATFARRSVPSPQLMTGRAPTEAVKQGSLPLRFMTVRMSASQLRQNGLFDSDYPNAPNRSENTAPRSAALPLAGTPNNDAAPESSASARSGSSPRTPPPPVRRAVADLGSLPRALSRGIEAELQSVGLAPRPRPPPPPRRSAPPLPALLLDEPEPAFEEPVALPQPVVAQTIGPIFATKRLVRSPFSVLGWSALAGLLIGAVIAGVFMKRTGGSATPAGADRRAALRMAAVESPIAASNVGVRRATTGGVSNESGTQAVHPVSVSAPQPIIGAQHSAASSEPPARRAPRAPVPAHRGVVHPRDYGI